MDGDAVILIVVPEYDRAWIELRDAAAGAYPKTSIVIVEDCTKMITLEAIPDSVLDEFSPCAVEFVQAGCCANPQRP